MLARGMQPAREPCWAPFQSSEKTQVGGVRLQGPAHQRCSEVCPAARAAPGPASTRAATACPPPPSCDPRPRLAQSLQSKEAV
eukprot:12915983-Alexandrium_andersonii.AAC.1